MTNIFSIRCSSVLLACSLVCIASSAFGGDITWKNVGPGGGGWIQSLTCDPRDPDTIYLGCDVGGFYISRDAGRTWRIQNEGLNTYFVQSIAVSPKDSNILLLGMQGGIFKSTDQGKTWAWKRQGFPKPSKYNYAAPIGALCFDPTRPNVLYAGIGRPRDKKEGKGLIYKSEDCGESWHVITPPGVLDPKAIINGLAVSPDGAFLIAATDKGLYRSDDNGKTWAASNAGLPHTNIQRVTIAPSSPTIVYCTLRTTARGKEAWNGGVFRSDDGGRTWTNRSAGLARRVGQANQPEQLTSNVRELVVDPKNPDVVYAGDWAWVSAGVYKTTDGGRTWTNTTRNNGPKKNMDFGWITQWGPAVECMAISPQKPNRLIFGTSGHTFLTDDGGRDWQQRYCTQTGDHFSGNGLEVTCFNNIFLDAKQPGRLYFCYFDIGLLTSDDGGRSFAKSVKGMKYNGNCFAIAIDPADSKRIWAGTGEWGANKGDVCRSDDQGRTWTVVGRPETGLPVGQTKCLLLDPNSPAEHRTLYVTSNGNGIFKSEDGGASWRGVNSGLPTSAKTYCGLLMDPNDSKHLLVAVGGSPAKGGGIYETTDSGASWRKKNQPKTLGDIQKLTADPNPKHFATLYACQRAMYDRNQQPPALLPGGLFRSDDGGATWRRIYANRFVMSVAVSPADSNVLYVTSGDNPYHDEDRGEGVAKSVDGGKTWQQEVDGLSCWNVSCIMIDPNDPSRLFIGTGGNGAFIGIDRAVKK